LENSAKVKTNLKGITDGEAYYEEYCNNGNIPFDDDRGSKSFLVSAGYPSPVISDINSEIAGFYLNGSTYTDVAVLSVVGFAPYVPEEYQFVAETFFANAAKDGKKKLVIDLSKFNAGL